MDKGKAKLYAVEVEDAKGDDRTVRGKILIQSVCVNVLFDSGCTHSFLSSRLVKSLGLQTSPLSKTYRIITAMGDGEVTTLGVTNLSLDIQRKPMCGILLCMGKRVWCTVGDGLVVRTLGFS